ncbi:acyl-CoA synthetase [Advenella faeciporci]|uniref:Acyl-CoA synthetase n=1 Tax=Advenella faeciporci TaxID=797535 RepID=A0A918JMD2_9BURK|nr:AMP-binding protein [Advenella faeciporci]GGW83351.1 acyl-CoA synthetase [Advenella faeciporci]
MTPPLSMEKLLQQKRLGDMMLDAFETYSDHCALVDENESVTYAELKQRIQRLICFLEKQNIHQGDVIAQLAGNSIGMFCVMAAAYIMGARSVTLHPMAGLDDHASLIKMCQPACIVTESHYAERAMQLKKMLDLPSRWFSHDEKMSFPCLHTLSQSIQPPNRLEAKGDAETIIRLAFTGGTSGQSKGVMLSNRSMLTNTKLWLQGLEWPVGVRTLCMAPISHGAGSFIYPTLFRGGTVYLHRKFSTETWFNVVATEKIQHTFVVPTMLYALLNDKQIKTADLSSLRALVYGAAPMMPERIREAMSYFGNSLVQTYGQTEAPNTILILNNSAHFSDTPNILQSAGRPFPNLNVALLNESGKEVEPGQVGEICVRGELIMSGYLDNQELTDSTIIDGWLHSGDMARQDSQGNFFIVDRKKDMIITGGFNVYPREIEDVLTSHPAVEQAAVIGIPDDKWGEAVKAIIVTKDSKEYNQKELIDFVKEKKGSICSPKSIQFVSTLPLTSLGKIDKKSLRASYSTI